MRKSAIVAAALAAGSVFGAPRPDVMAIYYPCWAPTPALESYFGKGWTEWDYIRSAPPRFPGHQQPVVPTCGYLRGDDPRDVEKEIDLAADHGVDVFLFDWYYYGGFKLMHESLEKGFLKAKNRNRIKFAIMWCCHEIDNEFRPAPDKPHERMYTLAKTEAGFAMLIDECMAYFREPNYYRHNGKLYFSIYSPQLLVKVIGVAGMRRAIDAARAKVRAAGLGEIEFNVQSGAANAQDMVDAGFDSLTDYVFNTYNDKRRLESKDRGTWQFDYGGIGELIREHWNRRAQGPLVYNPVVPTGWDPSPRARVDVPYPRPEDERRYPYGEIYTNATAAAFGRYLEQAKSFVAEDSRRSIVQIYAWNEYTEGGWLLPDGFSGDGRLKEIRRVFGPQNRVSADGDSRKELALLPDEQWYGAETVLGEVEPFSATNTYRAVDLRYDHGSGIGGNQAAPLLLSNKGRWVWCERPFVFRFADGRLSVTADRADAKVETGTAGSTLREAYLHCSRTFFPPQGTPKLEWFRNPIINTWASLSYHPTAEGILELARGFREMGVAPGVFMIDHGWHELPMGTWDFNLRHIPDPKGLVKTLKEEFGHPAVVLWLDNHMSMDSLTCREVFPKNYVLRSEAQGGRMPFMNRWWAGWAAVLDCTNPACFDWIRNRLQWLMDTYGVDGFFFDAGDPYDFIDSMGFDRNRPKPFDERAAPSDMTRAFHMLGTTVPYQQHRACWKMGGFALKQTERDKAPTFKALRMCLSNGIVAGLIGYPFIDFDMVGGGTVGPTQDDRVKVDQQQFVRSMQVQCLSPMVQLSIPPWKALDGTYLDAFKKAIAIRREWTPYIVETAVASGKTGEPMMRSLEYSFPGNGYETVMDEFMMGDRLLVAPQIEKDASGRKVLIPPGTWKGDDGQVVTGPCEIQTSTPLDRLPHWTKVTP